VQGCRLRVGLRNEVRAELGHGLSQRLRAQNLRVDRVVDCTRETVVHQSAVRFGPH
jgi:hypothetical protein